MSSTKTRSLFGNQLEKCNWKTFWTNWKWLKDYCNWKLWCWISNMSMQIWFQKILNHLTIHILQLARYTIYRSKYSRLLIKKSFYNVKYAQLPGRLFSPSDRCKKLSHHFLLHFSISMGSYDHHTKYQGVFP